MMNRVSATTIPTSARLPKTMNMIAMGVSPDRFEASLSAPSSDDVDAVGAVVGRCVGERARCERGRTPLAGELKEAALVVVVGCDRALCINGASASRAQVYKGVVRTMLSTRVAEELGTRTSALSMVKVR